LKIEDNLGPNDIIEKEEEENDDLNTNLNTTNLNGPANPTPNQTAELIKAKPNVQVLSNSKTNCKVECSSLPCNPQCHKLCKKNFCKSKCVIDPPICTRKCFSPKCTLECPKVLD